MEQDAASWFILCLSSIDCSYWNCRQNCILLAWNMKQMVWRFLYTLDGKQEGIKSSSDIPNYFPEEN